MLKKLILLAFTTAFLLNTSAQNTPQLLPQPADITLGCCTYSLDKKFKIKGNLPRSEKKFLREYIEQEFALQNLAMSNRGEIRTIHINLSADPSLSHLDSYTFDNTDGTAIYINCNSNAAAFYAICTMIQLADSRSQIQSCTISDYPRFPYRGIMLDCSRHFWDKSLIIRQIDAMARYKLNYLQLHLTDAGGWRFESKKYPELTLKTAFRTESDWNNWWVSGTDRQYIAMQSNEIGSKRLQLHLPTSKPYGGYYTQSELREIVNYAAQRHITIIPEIEMPGHSEEVIAALPYLACENATTCGAFCIGSEQTFEFLENILDEVMDIFPSEFIHIGGDETSREQWEACPKCQQRMLQEHLQTTAQLQSYLTARIERHLNQHGRQLLGWDEILEGTPAPNAMVMSWRGTEGGLKAAKMQHRVIMSPGGYCYLDAYQDAPATQPRAFGGYTPLKKTYSFEPIPTEIAATEYQNYIYGIQGNLWTEMVETPEHVEYMLWPRALAIAEIGWSQRHDDFPDFHRRAIDATNDMIQRGYHAFPLDKEIGERPESATFTNHEAIGKPVEYIAPYADVYKASGSNTLTDGLSGHWSYGDERWQGFITKGGFEVVIDMLQPTEISDIEVNFMQFAGPEIFAPASVSFQTSIDGKSFDNIYDRHRDVSRNPDYFIQKEVWQGNATARYIKVKATAGKYGGWLFTDEVFINKSR